MVTVSDDRMILIVAVAFFAGAAWGWWLRHMDAQVEASNARSEHNLIEATLRQQRRDSDAKAKAFGWN